ncbi:MAG: hypothetical protein ACK5RJ_04725 [Burkholderiales bacterium]|jgi:uncharacterized membrane protein YeaQ/YmgE (transglycosylase-associated protein family)|nr:hypothetical protein [Rhodocyclaceae bacterium]MCA3168062.1 hypothetical protein [Burkholderiales bacterium]
MEFSWWLFTLGLAGTIIGIGVLAIVGVRKSRAMSKTFVDEAARMNEAEIVTTKNRIRKQFLNPMSWAEVLGALIGAMVFLYVLRNISSFVQ